MHLLPKHPQGLQQLRLHLLRLSDQLHHEDQAHLELLKSRWAQLVQLHLLGHLRDPLVLRCPLHPLPKHQLHLLDPALPLLLETHGVRLGLWVPENQ